MELLFRTGKKRPHPDNNNGEAKLQDNLFEVAVKKPSELNPVKGDICFPPIEFRRADFAEVNCFDALNYIILSGIMG